MRYFWNLLSNPRLELPRTPTLPEGGWIAAGGSSHHLTGSWASYEGPVRSCRVRARLRFVVRDELKEGAIRVAEVYARAGTSGAGALDGTHLDLDAVTFQVLPRLVDRPRPLEKRYSS
jgi:hypothetical protein